MLCNKSGVITEASIAGILKNPTSITMLRTYKERKPAYVTHGGAVATFRISHDDAYLVYGVLSIKADFE